MSPSPKRRSRRSFWICPARSMPNTAMTLASSLLEPIITGTECWRAAKKTSSMASGRTQSPTIGAGAMLSGAVSGQNDSGGIARSCSAVAFSSPKWAASASPFCSACWRGVSGKVYPLWTIALWNSPSASGEASNDSTLRAPADSPNRVTLCGSPPNAVIFSRTHSSAAI